MNGWIAMGLFVLAVAAGLYPFVRRDKGAMQFVAAALLLALAGYSWQGNPSMAGSPKALAEPQPVPDDDFAVLHPDLLGRFDRAYSWMVMADASRRQGDPHGAAQILESAVRANPRDWALWTAYGYGLIAAGGDQPSPASQLAFERAAALAPNHPAPMFFYALGLMRGGNYDQAEQVWREQLGTLQGYPLYRAAINERLAALAEARANQTEVRVATVPVAEAGNRTEPAGNSAEAAGNTVAPTGNTTD